MSDPIKKRILTTTKPTRPSWAGFFFSTEKIKIKSLAKNREPFCSRRVIEKPFRFCCLGHVLRRAADNVPKAQHGAAAPSTGNLTLPPYPRLRLAAEPNRKSKTKPYMAASPFHPTRTITKQSDRVGCHNVPEASLVVLKCKGIPQHPTLK